MLLRFYTASSFTYTSSIPKQSVFLDPNQYKKIIKMILGANLNNPTATRDTLLSMLRGKPELSDQVRVC